MKHLLWWVFVLLLTAACANDKDFTPTDEPAMLVSGNVSVREAEQNLKKTLSGVLSHNTRKRDASDCIPHILCKESPAIKNP